MTIRVIGEPAPQGSKRPVGNGRMIESSKKVRPWRDSVAWAAREACEGRPPLAVPCGISIVFYLPRPKKPKFPKYPGTKPDIDKLVRSTLDGLTNGGAFADDALVVEEIAYKRWADPGKGRHIGAVIEIWEAD